jgi:hypothetical protein
MTAAAAAAETATAAAAQHHQGWTAPAQACLSKNDQPVVLLLVYFTRKAHHGHGILLPGLPVPADSQNNPIHLQQPNRTHRPAGEAARRD